MDKRFSNFIKGLSAIAIALTAISLLILLYVPEIPITKAFLYILIFIYLSTLFVFKILLKGQQEKFNQFVNMYLLVNFGKLFIYIIIVFAYALINRPDAVSFILTFFIYYFVFSFFEIISLLKIKR